MSHSTSTTEKHEAFLRQRDHLERGEAEAMDQYRELTKQQERRERSAARALEPGDTYRPPFDIRNNASFGAR